MAQEAAPLYNFYFRYPWDEDDFSNWQAGMVNLQRGAMEGTFGAACLKGFDLSAVSGMVLQAASGIAVGPSGYLMVENNNTLLTFNPPVTYNRLDLVVINALLTNADFITRPTQPFDSVPLQTLQDCQVSVIQGAESATPDFPSVPAGATVIAGVYLTPGMSTFPDTKYCGDFNKRDIPGKNSNFQQNAARYDDRIRPYKSTVLLLGIKPSQLIHPNSRAFTFTNNNMPSIFPKSGGLYNHADTFLNFQTGAITGGDTTSSAFSPTIPAAGSYINATVALTPSDTLQITYGTAGTHQQCLDGISNQISSGAGSVGQPVNAKPVAIVTVGSIDGSNIASLEYVDCRGTSAIGLTNPMTNLGDIIAGGVSGAPARIAPNTSTVTQFLSQTGTGSAGAAPTWRQSPVPTQQVFLSGSGTYTKPPSCLYIRVRMIGAGSGGTGSSTVGALGGNTTFGTSLLTAAGGGAPSSLDGGAGGGATVTPTAGLTALVAIAGSNGQGGLFVGGGLDPNGGNGGSTPFGGAGSGGAANQNGPAASANSGAGGGGAGSTVGGGTGYPGGGAGGYIEAVITAPSSTYSYSVGAGGAGGTGTFTGGAGGSGAIIVEEYYM